MFKTATLILAALASGVTAETCTPTRYTIKSEVDAGPDWEADPGQSTCIGDIPDGVDGSQFATIDRTEGSDKQIIEITDKR